MIYPPGGGALFVLLFFLLAVLIVAVELRILAYAYRKIGVHPRYIFAVMLLSLLGSYINIPMYSVPVERLEPPHMVEQFGRVYIVPQRVEPGATVVAVNLGGALIPAVVSAYLFLRSATRFRMLLGVVLMAIVANRLARVIPGVGIVVPTLVPPLAAAAIGLVLARRQAPPVAYVVGSMGTLIGADLMNLGKVTSFGAPIISIGGAGTFDGVFLTGIIAGLLV
jgi:uncharacterized membrane protein